MLGLLLIYFIGKRFYELAHEYNKHQWGFAILGIVAYYFGTVILGVSAAIIDAFFQTNIVDGSSNLTLGIVAIPFGLFSCWGLYRILENSWKKKEMAKSIDILDDDIII